MSMLVAALVQRAAKDAWAGATGRTFPSQQYRLKRLELKATRAANSGQSPVRRPARDYFAGLWALAWDTQYQRQQRRWDERQDRWDRRRSGEHRDRGKPRPARDFAAAWWQTGPAQRWRNAWGRAAEKRKRKLGGAGEPADRQAGETDVPVAPVVPGPRSGGRKPETPPAEAQPEPAPLAPPRQPRDGGDDLADNPEASDDASDSPVPNEREGTEEMTVSTSTASPALASGEAPTLDAKQAFVQSYATVFPAIKVAFLNFANTLAVDEYGAGTQGAAVRAAEAVSAAEVAVAELAEIVCGAAVDIRDRAAAAGFEVGRDALRQ